jgi:hypothetical protein
MPLLKRATIARKLWPLALLGSSGLLDGCASIVGIEDTTVTREDGNAGSNTHASGSAGAAQAGTANRGDGMGESSAGGTLVAAGAGG